MALERLDKILSSTGRWSRKEIKDITDKIESEHERAVRSDLALDTNVYGADRRKLIRRKEREMKEAVKVLDFETAAILRDEIRELEKH